MNCEEDVNINHKVNVRKQWPGFHSECGMKNDKKEKNISFSIFPRLYLL